MAWRSAGSAGRTKRTVSASDADKVMAERLTGTDDCPSTSIPRICFDKKKSIFSFATAALSAVCMFTHSVFTSFLNKFSGSSASSFVFVPNKSSCGFTVFCLFSPFLINLSASFENSSSVNIFCSSASSMSLMRRASRSSAMGTSQRMVARKRDIRMSSVAASTFSRSLPLMSAVFDRRVSMSPNCVMSLTAVFSPTPGQPGKLSAESPIRAKRSITCWGELMPYFSVTSSGPMTS